MPVSVTRQRSVRSPAALDIPRLRRMLASNLKHARQAAGLSQAALASACQVPRTQISCLERAKQEPRVSTLVMLSMAMGTPLSRLLEGVEDLAESP